MSEEGCCACVECTCGGDCDCTDVCNAECAEDLKDTETE